MLQRSCQSQGLGPSQNEWLGQHGGGPATEPEVEVIVRLVYISQGLSPVLIEMQAFGIQCLHTALPQNLGKINRWQHIHVLLGGSTYNFASSQQICNCVVHWTRVAW